MNSYRLVPAVSYCVINPFHSLLCIYSTCILCFVVHEHEHMITFFLKIVFRDFWNTAFISVIYSLLLLLLETDFSIF